jgi:hypothetical protein
MKASSFTGVDAGGPGFGPICISLWPHRGQDGVVGRFRCSIAGMMAAVVLVALDCMAIRTPLSGLSVTACMLLLGGLPMANILAAGLLILLADRSGRGVYRPWLVGFEVAGWTALFLYASCAYYRPYALREYVVHALTSLRALGNSALITAVVVALSAPQLGLAILGGWVNRKYEIVVTIGGLIDRYMTTAR